MLHGRGRSAAGLAALASALWACSGGIEPYDNPPTDGDLDVDADSDLDADGDTDGEVDGAPDSATDAEVDSDAPDSDYERLSGPGPLTFVSASVAVVSDRLCDLDGDGDLDNVFTDLGSPADDLTIMAVNAALISGATRESPKLVHFPWVEDRASVTDDDVVVLSLFSVDTDVPPDATDDRSGHEPFWCSATSLDACGEPTEHMTGVSLERGAIDASEGVGRLPLVEGIAVRDARVQGTIAPGGTGADVFVCACAAFNDIGGGEADPDLGGLTLLEVLLAGGEAYGILGIPGLSPDLDNDHDGLERIELDGENHVARCIDGDLTVIEGRDCWQDPRMADGFSFNMQLVGVPAELLGREPGWQDIVTGTCESPPETSLFDPR